MYRMLVIALLFVVAVTALALAYMLYVPLEDYAESPIKEVPDAPQSDLEPPSIQYPSEKTGLPETGGM